MGINQITAGAWQVLRHIAASPLSRSKRSSCKCELVNVVKRVYCCCCCCCLLALCPLLLPPSAACLGCPSQRFHHKLLALASATKWEPALPLLLPLPLLPRLLLRPLMPLPNGMTHPAGCILRLQLALRSRQNCSRRRARSRGMGQGPAVLWATGRWCYSWTHVNLHTAMHGRRLACCLCMVLPQPDSPLGPTRAPCQSNLVCSCLCLMLLALSQKQLVRQSHLVQAKHPSLPPTPIDSGLHLYPTSSSP